MLKIRKKNIKVFKNLLSWWCVSWCSVCKFLHSGPDVAEKKLVSVNRYYARRTWSHFGEETVERSRDGGRFRNGFQSFKFDYNCKQTADLADCLHLYVCKPCLLKKGLTWNHAIVRIFVEIFTAAIFLLKTHLNCMLLLWN